MVRMQKIKVNYIQKVCFHDGPGIRTTIFLNSCLLKCPWCANPETSRFTKKYYVNDNCRYGGSCPYKLTCEGKKSSNELLAQNYNLCPVEAIEKNVKEYSVSELEEIILEDNFLYKKDGGVTFSGGEPLIQSDVIKELFIRLKKQNINIAVETCLYVSKENIEKIIEYVDLFIIDIKILDTKESAKVLGGNLEKYLTNVDYIFKNRKKVIFRIPLIKPYITSESNLEEIYNLLKEYKPSKVEIFKGHNLAREKYLKLGLNYNEVETMNDDEILDIKNKINNLDINVEIISF